MGDSSDILSNRPRFNRPTHDYIFTGAQFRAGNDVSSVRFSKGINFIDISNGGIDMSSSNVNINNNLRVNGTTTIGGELNITGSTSFANLTGNNFTINGDLSVNSMISNILKVPSIFTIDPSGHGTGGTENITGKVVILGDLEVKGTTTTINSNRVDISDLSITLASNATTPSQAIGAGFDICGTGGASFRYALTSGIGTFQSSIGLGISGNLLPSTNSSRVPVSFNTFKLKTTGLNTYTDTSDNAWIPLVGYDISITVLSNWSYIKMEFKVNYISSPEAEQTLGLRVEKSINNQASWTHVFTDPSLGSNMGVGILAVHNGTYIDDLSGASISLDTVTYRLSQWRNRPSYDTTISSFGVIGGANVGNYIFLQELYRPLPP
jgi:hypothetical protein